MPQYFTPPPFPSFCPTYLPLMILLLHCQTDFLRDVLRISTKKAIAAVEKLPDHSLMALVDELYPTGAPWNEGVELEQMP